MKILSCTVALALLFSALLSFAGCDTSEPTSAVVDNGFPAPPDGGDPALQTAVFKVWWFVTLFPDPVAAGSSSDVNRVVPASEYAYALLAPNWDPASGAPPTTLIPVRLKDKVSVARGDIVRITVSEETVEGNCSGGTALSQDDADFITQRIFPGDFASVTYDAVRCVASPVISETDASASDAQDGSSAGDAALDGGPG
jgi:hypothetical protein